MCRPDVSTMIRSYFSFLKSSTPAEQHIQALAVSRKSKMQNLWTPPKQTSLIQAFFSDFHWICLIVVTIERYSDLAPRRQVPMNSVAGYQEATCPRQEFPPWKHSASADQKRQRGRCLHKQEQSSSLTTSSRNRQIHEKPLTLRTLHNSCQQECMKMKHHIITRHRKYFTGLFDCNGVHTWYR